MAERALERFVAGQRTINRIMFAGAAHLDRIGTFSSHGAAGLSTPGTMVETFGGAALNTARTVASHGIDTALHCVVAAQGVHDLASREQFVLTAQENASDIQFPSYTALLQPDGSLLAALSDMQAYNKFEAAQMDTHPDDWLCVDANLESPEIHALLERPVAMRFALAVSAAKAGRLRGVLHLLDLLFSSRSEAAALTGANEDTVTNRDLAFEMRQLGVQRAVVTNGADPLMLIDEIGRAHV